MRNFFRVLLLCGLLSVIHPFNFPANAQGDGTLAYLRGERIGRGSSDIVGWREDGQAIAFSINNEDVIMFDLQLQQTNIIDDNAGFAPTLNSDWTLLTSVSGALFVYDIEHKQRIAQLPFSVPPDEGIIARGVWRADNEQVAYYDQAVQSIVIWDAVNLQPVTSWVLADGRPYDIAWSPDGNWLAVSHGDVLNLWDVQTETIIRSVLLNNMVSTLEWNANSDYLAVANDAGLLFWNISTGDSYLSTTVGSDVITVSWGNNYIATSHNNEDRVRIWSFTAPDQIQFVELLPVFPAAIRMEVEWSPASDILAIATGTDIFLWDQVTGNFIAQRSDFLDEPRGFDAKADGSQISAIVKNSNGPDPVDIWDVEANTFVQRILPQTTDIIAVAMHPSDDVVAFTEADGLSYLFETSDEIVEPIGNFGTIVEWNHSEDWLAATTERGGTLLNVANNTTTEINGFLTHGTWHTSQLRVVGLDAPTYGTPTVWDAQTGEELLRLNTGAHAVVWSYDSSKLITAERFTVSIWDATTGDLQSVFDIAQPPTVLIENHAGQLIVARPNYRIESYDIATGQLIGELNSLYGIEFGSTLQMATDGTVFTQLSIGDLYFFRAVSEPPLAPSVQDDQAFLPTETTAGFVLDDENPQDDGLEEDGFEVEWRGGWQGTFSEWTPYTTLPANPGTGSVAFELAQPIACEYGIIQVRVRAFYDTQPRLHSEWSNTAEVNLPCDDPTLPSPSNLVIDGANSLPVVITWTDNASDEQGHRIERSVDGGAFIEIGTQSPNSTIYTDTTAVCGVNYAYRVRAARTSPLPLDSIPSNEVSVSVGCDYPTFTTNPAAAMTGTTDFQGNCDQADVIVNAALIEYSASSPFLSYTQSVEHLGTLRIDYADGSAFLPERNILIQTRTGISFEVQGDPYARSAGVPRYYAYTFQSAPPGEVVGHGGPYVPLPSNSIWHWRVQNTETGVCQRITVNVNCSSQTATITENLSTCELPPVQPSSGGNPWEEDISFSE